MGMKTGTYYAHPEKASTQRRQRVLESFSACSEAKSGSPVKQSKGIRRRRTPPRFSCEIQTPQSEEEEGNSK